MKTILAAVMATAMLMSLGACGDKKDEEKKMIVGELTDLGQTAEELEKNIKDGIGRDSKIMFYDDLTSMLQALKSERIQMMSVPDSVAAYVAAQNSDVKQMTSENTDRKVTISLSMAVKDSDTELLEVLNTAIKALKEDGTVDALYKHYVTDATADAVPAAMPNIESANTIKVVVTGDLPPLDYFSTDGIPAGFNVALLSAISEMANLNIELVTSNAASRTTQLSSGKADAIFWMRNISIQDKDGNTIQEDNEAPSGVVLTESYLTEKPAKLVKK